MTVRTFASWVEPVAVQLQGSREAIADLAGQIPSEAWSQPSPVEGWTYQDVLSHLAAGDVFFQTVVNAVVTGGQLDLRPISAEREARTARILDERRRRTINELLAEVEAEGQETQELLARLTDSDELVEVYTSRATGTPTSLGEFLRLFPVHDREHVAHLRTALEPI